MCRDYNGYHSGGSSFVYVNDSWLLQNYLYTHRYKLNSEKKKKSPSTWFRTRNRFGFANRVGPGIGGVTVKWYQSLGLGVSGKAYVR